MTTPRQAPHRAPRTLEGRVFLLLVALVSAAFLVVLVPYAGAVFWGAVLAFLFVPLFRRLLTRFKDRRTVAALATVAVILLLVILPLAFILTQLVQEAAGVYQRVQTGELDFARYFRQTYEALPGWAISLLDRAGLGDLGLIQQKLTQALSRGSQLIATQALSIGQNALDFVVSFFVMLYLLYFLLRDGDGLSAAIRRAVPLDDAVKRELIAKFLTVVRATVKGNIAVAAVQGALGGLFLWFLGVHAPVLWGTLMAFLSLLPAVGAALVWVPIALYFLATGAIVKAVVLTAAGVLVIGLVDNVLRPILVGKDTQMPDYVVLISTLGGMTVFGINGFVMGPVVAAMFIAVWNLFTELREDRHAAAAADATAAASNAAAVPAPPDAVAPAPSLPDVPSAPTNEPPPAP